MRPSLRLPVILIAIALLASSIHWAASRQPETSVPAATALSTLLPTETVRPAIAPAPDLTPAGRAREPGPPISDRPSPSGALPQPTRLIVRDTPRASGEAEICVVKEVPYIEHPGVDACHTSLDIYAPAEAQGLPVLAFVHGGGWSAGDKAAVGLKAAYFTGHGFVFVSINYRLIPIAWPAEQAADVARAVAWLREHIGDYGGDGQRIFMLGHSAGAHLTALIANDETYLRRAGQDLRALRGVILLDSGAYDVEQLMRSPDAQLDVYRMPFGGDPARWQQLSPRAHVSPGKGTPPHLLLVATAGGQRRPGAESLASALRAAGVYAHVADASAFRDHISLNEELGRPGDPPTAAIQAFLDMLLRGAPDGYGGFEVLQPGP